MGQGLSIKKIRRKKNITKQRSTGTQGSDTDSNYSGLTAALQEHERGSIYRTLLSSLFNSDFSAPIEDVLVLHGKIMETACGSGSWIVDMALKYPNSEFIGLDLNPVPPSVTPRNTKFIIGNLKSIPCEDEEFDYIKTGDLQTDFTEIEYKHAIEEMIRVTKRGGWIEINEPDIYPSSHAPNYVKLIESYWGFLALRGIDAQMTTKLQYILYSTNNLQDIQFEYKTLIVGPRGGELGNQIAELCEVYFRDLFGQEIADYLGLTYEDYLQTLWKKAREEIDTICIEIKYYRFWGQKK